MAMMNSETAGNVVKVSLKGDVRYATEETWQKAAEELRAKHGGGFPVIERIPSSRLADAPTAPNLIDQILSGDTAAPVVVEPAPNPDTVGPAKMDVVGRSRSQRDREAAEAAGFSTLDTVYERGLRVIELGVENARAKRAEFDAMPEVADYCAGFIEKIKAEERTDHVVQSSTLSMTDKGLLVVPERGELPITTVGFGGLVNRLDMGGAAYLAKCWPELRAYNLNQWTAKRARDEKAAEAEALAKQAAGERNATAPQPWRVKLRERNASKGGREIFGAVGPRYTSFDVDMVAEALRQAAPEGARGGVSYDGNRARFEVLFHSTVQPEHYVAGEFFRAGVIVTTDDTGGGSLSGSAVVWQNLCLNLIIIDEAKQRLFSLRHIGSVEKLATEFRAGFDKALGKIDHFRKAWGYAVKDDVVSAARKLAQESGGAIPVNVEEVMPGLFNAVLESEIVKIKGNRESVVEALMECWQADNSAAAGPTRAAMVNAFTRFAHTRAADMVEDWSTWSEDELQRDAAQLLYGSRGRSPAPIEFVALEEVLQNTKVTTG